VRSFGGRASQFQRVRRVKPPRAPAATFPETPPPEPAYEWVDLGPTVTNFGGGPGTVNALLPGAPGDVGIDYFGPLPNGPFSDGMAAYDITTDSWITGAAFATAPQGGGQGTDVVATTNTVNRIIMTSDRLFPGTQFWNMTYNTLTNTWDDGVTRTPMPVGVINPAYNHFSVDIGGDPHVIIIAGLALAAFPVSGNDVDDVQIYNVTTDTWTTGTAWPGHTGGPIADWAGLVFATIGQKIYVWDNNNDLGYKYDVDADTWTAITPLPVQALSACPHPNVFVERLVIGNEAGSAATFIYDAPSDTFSSAPDLPTTSAVLLNGVRFDGAYFQDGNDPDNHYWRFGLVP